MMLYRLPFSVNASMADNLFGVAFAPLVFSNGSLSFGSSYDFNLAFLYTFDRVVNSS